MPRKMNVVAADSLLTRSTTMDFATIAKKSLMLCKCMWPKQEALLCTIEDGKSSKLSVEMVTHGKLNLKQNSK